MEYEHLSPWRKGTKAAFQVSEVRGREGGRETGRQGEKFLTEQEEQIIINWLV